MKRVRVFERFSAYLKQLGLNNFKNYLEELLNEWENVSIHTDITEQ
jgi:hypothetical protein